MTAPILDVFGVHSWTTDALLAYLWLKVEKGLSCKFSSYSGRDGSMSCTFRSRSSPTIPKLSAGNRGAVAFPRGGSAQTRVARESERDARLKEERAFAAPTAQRALRRNPSIRSLSG